MIQLIDLGTYGPILFHIKSLYYEFRSNVTMSFLMHLSTSGIYVKYILSTCVIEDHLSSSGIYVKYILSTCIIEDHIRPFML
jgi:hypothetical protein